LDVKSEFLKKFIIFADSAVPLPEDRELQGFLPLESAMSGLRYDFYLFLNRSKLF